LVRAVASASPLSIAEERAAAAPPWASARDVAVEPAPVELETALPVPPLLPVLAELEEPPSLAVA
jgi:hypothetical protein